MGTQKTRQAKIEFLKSAIEAFFKKKKDGQISKDRLIAEFAISQYSSYRTAEELIEALAETGYIKINGDVITR